MKAAFPFWDDGINFFENPSFRGLGAANLRWMWTTFHAGHYIPLSWMTLGLDYVLWGLAPAGYHLTNNLLHALNAALAAVLAARIYRRARPEAGDTAVWAGAAAALFFALHPLRVESVAWITQRRDVLSAFFLLGAALAYVTRPGTRWALALYVLSLLSKAGGLGFGVVLLLLDFYPLRRLAFPVAAWGPRERAVLWEKAPYLLLGAVFAFVAGQAQTDANAAAPLQAYGFADRFAQALYGARFYLEKTVFPSGLIPLYDFPKNFSFWRAATLWDGLAAAALLAAGTWAGRRWAAVAVAGLAYLCFLAPVSGIFQSGPQFVADRYSYLSCFGWAVLAGGILLRGERGWARAAAWVAAGAVIAGAAFMTRRQIALWTSPEPLWQSVLAVNPDSFFANYNLANYRLESARPAEAIPLFEKALRPDVPAERQLRTLNNLGQSHMALGAFDKALFYFQAAARLDPSAHKAYFNMGKLHFLRDDLARAALAVDESLKRRADYAPSHRLLGLIALKEGRPAEAGGHFRTALAHAEDFEARRGLEEAERRLRSSSEKPSPPR